MIYCERCNNRLTVEEMTHDLGGLCFSCWLPPATVRPQSYDDEVAYWRSEDAMRDDDEIAAQKGPSMLLYALEIVMARIRDWSRRREHRRAWDRAYGKGPHGD